MEVLHEALCQKGLISDFGRLSRPHQGAYCSDQNKRRGREIAKPWRLHRAIWISQTSSNEGRQ